VDEWVDDDWIDGDWVEDDWPQNEMSADGGVEDGCDLQNPRWCVADL
jgi:hypothetical protein